MKVSYSTTKNSGKMNKKEFVDLFTDESYDLFFELADTVGLDKEKAYHKCNFCDYMTKEIYIGDLYEMDNAIANHLWNNHREICIKKAMEYQSKSIATREGQKTLDEVEK